MNPSSDWRAVAGSADEQESSAKFQDALRSYSATSRSPRRLAGMRLLVLSLFNPVPADNGVKMRTWMLLRALAAEGCDLTLLTFAGPRSENGHRSSVDEICCHVEEFRQTRRSLSAGRDYAIRICSLTSPLPYGVRGSRSTEMRQRILSLLEAQEIDVVLCEQSEPLINLPVALPVPLIVDHHNVEHLILRRYSALERNPGKKLYALLESRKLRRWERIASQRATLGIACSQYDRALLQELCPSLPIHVIPNALDADSYMPGGEEEEPFKILYQGGMDWYPNQDAVEFFIEAILPRLRKLAPGLRFVVAGRNPPDEFCRRFAGIPHVEFTGALPDMRPEIATAAVCVVPLRIGSGTRLKILEAAAMAKPIVSTPIGAEGFDFVDGEEILLADRPRQFADAVADLLADPPRRCAMGLAARRRVEKQYCMPALRSAFHEVLAQLAPKSSTDYQRPEFSPASVEAGP